MTAPNKTHHVPFFRKEISMIAASTCTKIMFCENVTYLVFAFSASYHKINSVNLTIQTLTTQQYTLNTQPSGPPPKILDAL